MKESNENLQELDSELSVSMQHSLVKMMKSRDSEVIKTAHVIIDTNKRPGVMINITNHFTDRNYLSFQQFVRINACFIKTSLTVAWMCGRIEIDKEYYDILERLEKY